MRMMKMGGAPCDRRPDRRKVAMAAFAALFLSATVARAGSVDFVIVQALSDIKQTVKLVGPAFAKAGGSITSSPQVPGSDHTSLFGHINADITPSDITLKTGSSLTFDVNRFGGGPASLSTQLPVPFGSGPLAGPFTPGPGYAPFDPVSSDPVGPPPVGFTKNSAYGYAFPLPGVDLTATIYNLRWDFGAPPQTGLPLGVPTTPMPFAGTQFNLFGQAVSYATGRQAFVSGLGNSSDNSAGFPALFGTGGTDLGTWDGTTLTIPIHSKITFHVTDAAGGIDETVSVSGTIVAVPYVPEPSTMTMLGFGVVGLLSYAWRARKRRALVA